MGEGDDGVVAACHGGLEGLVEDDAAPRRVGAIVSFLVLARLGEVEERIEEGDGFWRADVTEGGEGDGEEPALLAGAPVKVFSVLGSGEADMEGEGAIAGGEAAVGVDEGAGDGGVQFEGGLRAVEPLQWQSVSLLSATS